MERKVIPPKGGYPGGAAVRFIYRGEQKHLFLIPYVKGLVREGERVRRLLEEARPEVLLLHISPEELEGLKDLVENHRKVGREALSAADSVYLAVLEVYGEVELPSPSLRAALEYGLREGKPVKGVDISEADFTELYLKHVSFLTRLRRDRALKGALRYPLPPGRPQEALMILDREVMKLKGFRAVESERMKWQGRAVFREALRWKRAAFLQEVERAEESLAELLRRAEKRGEAVEVERFPEEGQEE
ncbi:MAG: hypothetical protein DRN55_01155 [Thermoplasmata archaeon]|nr:MAG: hypothetical protein DRN55_01155 [Thermoplasmata archaeon]